MASEPAPEAQSATETATKTKLNLNPPEALQPVAPAEVAGLVPLKTEETSELDKRVAQFVDESGIYPPPAGGKPLWILKDELYQQYREWCEGGGYLPLSRNKFNRQIAKLAGNDPLEFSNDALDALLAYRWPGNVRELKNLVERLHILARSGTIELQDLPGEISAGNRDTMAMHGDHPTAMLEAPVCSFEDAERQAIKNALVAEGGNLSKVALRLGISRPTLYRKLGQYGIRRGFL